MCAVQGAPYTIFGYKGKQVRDQIHASDVAAVCLEFFNAPRIRAVPFPELGQCLSAPKVSTCNNNFGPDGATVDPNVQQFKASYSTQDVAAGLRFRMFGHFLLTGNVLFKVNDAGLRSKYVPLVGITYSH